jgi:RimJ/RimL family protein N-acetyltransferase
MSGLDDPAPSAHYLFFRYDGELCVESPRLAPQYECSIWRPAEGRPWPEAKCSAKTRLRFLFRYCIYYLGLFANTDCGALCIMEQGKLIHYSAFTPRYWRFPFLRDKDLQVGDTWTEPSHRGRGLAFFALTQIPEELEEAGRHFWYVVGRENLPSIAVVEKAGFT